jgi:predicted ribosome quality control (RQC) complex YloA/Tae2 family protein
MYKMTNLDYSFIVKELSYLVGKHFSRIRKLGEGLYRMKIGSTEIVCEPGIRLHATRHMEEAETPDKFVQKVSKELDNAKLLSVEQVNNDRVVSFSFTKGQLVFELFGDGNTILVRDGKTVCAARYESWAGREIKAGADYKTPPNIPSEKLELSDRYVITSLVKLPLGKEYALEALARAGIDEKKPGTELSKEEVSRLERELASIKESATPYVFYEEGKPVALSLAKLSIQKESKTFPTLSEAADEYYSNVERPDPRLEKLTRRLEKQQERLLLLSEEEKDNKAKGDYIYGKYTEIEKILELARAGRFGDIELKYKGKVNKKEKSVEVEI